MQLKKYSGYFIFALWEFWVGRNKWKSNSTVALIGNTIGITVYALYSIYKQSKVTLRLKENKVPEDKK